MKRGYIKTYLKMLFVILIIVGIVLGTIYILKDEYNHEKFETLKTDMLLIEGKIKIVGEKVNIKEKDAKYIGTSLTEIKDNEQVKKLQEKQIIDLESKEHIYYALNSRHLEELGLNAIELRDGIYIVDYKTNEIIYANGIEDANGNMLYKLSDMENIQE